MNSPPMGVWAMHNDAAYDQEQDDGQDDQDEDSHGTGPSGLVSRALTLTRWPR